MFNILRAMLLAEVIKWLNRYKQATKIMFVRVVSGNSRGPWLYDSEGTSKSHFLVRLGRKKITNVNEPASNVGRFLLAFELLGPFSSKFSNMPSSGWGSGRANRKLAIPSGAVWRFAEGLAFFTFAEDKHDRDVPGMNCQMYGGAMWSPTHILSHVSTRNLGEVTGYQTITVYQNRGFGRICPKILSDDIIFIYLIFEISSRSSGEHCKLKHIDVATYM
ncbi:uncharacterized protein MELLADRAFT_101668 [Melampsora larici-populina 98AG31]|uniref:Uncharacterized protein n=1 Tax=Melampsora larici-populina (strain 98AG31 / pathotype 3-4-7) TaxID=747676 RepID=F4R6K9_MELLP|nr:uncharacterized protein MELLADRAFT_101668 [Melampsora larici-populina 98AG31]EGG11898.1 hypothetical protein MELLADRAFT_101668 [Melampsora larici-populina 98AG31]